MVSYPSKSAAILANTAASAYGYMSPPAENTTAALHFFLGDDGFEPRLDMHFMNEPTIPSPQPDKFAAPGSVSWLLAQWPEQEAQATERVCAEYFPRLVALARRTLGAYPAAAAEADDVVQSALWSWCEYMRKSASDSPRRNRADVWRLLCRMVVFKARRRWRRRTHGQPGGGERPFADLDLGHAGEPAWAGLEDLPPAEVDLLFADVLAVLDDGLRPVALLLVQGYEQAEIAARLQCSVRTVQRKIALIRRILEAELAE